MAQTKRKRQRKHRGTQGGAIDRRGRRGRPRSREEARAQARRRAEYRRQQTAPTWRSAITKGLIGAVVFFFVIVLLFGRPMGEASLLAFVMLAMYVPLSYFIDNFFYRRRRAQELKARQAAKQERQAAKQR